MESIKNYVEQFIRLTGISGNAVPIVRHVLLVLVTILLAWAAGALCRKILIPVVHRITSKTKGNWDETLFNDNVLKTASRIVPAIVVSWLLPMVFFQYAIVHTALEKLTAIYIVVMSVKLFIALINSLTQLKLSSSPAVRQYIRTFCGVLKVIVIFITVIVVVAILFNKNPMVFKDTIEGLVAGIRLTSNDMVRKGDWITVPSTPADGVVEDISLTTVKVRNFDDTTVTVPPLALVSGSFQNWRSMQKGAGRRVKRLLYIDFRSVKLADETLKNSLLSDKLITEEQMQDQQVNIALFRLFIEQYLTNRTEVNEKQTLLVRQMEATPSGLPIEFYFFIKNSPDIHYEEQSSPPIHINIKTNINHITYEENTTRGIAIARRKHHTGTENGARKTATRDGQHCPHAYRRWQIR